MSKESELEQCAIQRREYEAKRDLLAPSLGDEHDPVKAQNGHLRRENIAKRALLNSVSDNDDCESLKQEKPILSNYGEYSAKEALLKSCLDSDDNVADSASSFQSQNQNAEIVKKESEARRALLHTDMSFNGAMNVKSSGTTVLEERIG